MVLPTISIADIKYDLLKIIEPWDGILAHPRGKQVYHLFVAYLNDLRKAGEIREFRISTTSHSEAVTFDISIKISADRTPKKLKIHVGMYQPA